MTECAALIATTSGWKSSDRVAQRFLRALDEAEIGELHLVRRTHRSRHLQNAERDDRRGAFPRLPETRQHAQLRALRGTSSRGFRHPRGRSSSPRRVCWSLHRRVRRTPLGVLDQLAAPSRRPALPSFYRWRLQRQSGAGGLGVERSTAHTTVPAFAAQPPTRNGDFNAALEAVKVSTGARKS